MKQRVSIFWFRRDLRLSDNAGLYEALKSGYPVLPIFIFDPNILSELPNNDARVSFIHLNLSEINERLKNDHNRYLAIYYDQPESVFESLLNSYDVHAIYTNKDYEPYAQKRDARIREVASAFNCEFHLSKDQVIFEEDQITKDNGDPYVVYTPYKKSWRARFDMDQHLGLYPSAQNLDKLLDNAQLPWKSLSDIGFVKSNIPVPTFELDADLINNYEATRNFPALKKGTSRIGPHLRFGTVSIREVMRLAISQKNETYQDELIWREFFMQILWHYPHTVNKAFKPKYDRIQWRNDKNEFEAWKTGKTGYPLVDAGMRELNATGYMHNRVRMLVASFLCKHLLIDWRWGEAYFAEKLLDFELSSNVGNWQWAAGSGVDAAPYFRIFNPMTQADKFDKGSDYIKKWVPEFNDPSYVQPVVEHKFARERCLDTFKLALNS